MSKSKKPKPNVLELPGNLGEEQLPAVTMHLLTKQMPGRAEDRRKGKPTAHSLWFNSTKETEGQVWKDEALN